MSKDTQDEKGEVLTFDNSRKKPRAIDRVLPWPPSEGLVKEMEQGLVTSASFAIQLVVNDPAPTNDEVIKRIENKRKL